MRVAGIDTHKATLAACVIDEIGQPLAEAIFPNDPSGFSELLVLEEHRDHASRPTATRDIQRG